VFLSAAYGLKSITFSNTPRSADSPHIASRLAALLTKAIDTIFFRALCPSWLATLARYVPIPFLSGQMRDIENTYEQLRTQMLEFIGAAREAIAISQTENDTDERREARRTNAVKGDAALLKSLVEANMSQEGEYKRLTDDELLSNVFVRLTSAFFILTMFR
jgi:hypothetical protein